MSTSQVDNPEHLGGGQNMNLLKFPKDFLWGTATSAHQVEGNNIHSDWWTWEQEKAGQLGGPRDKSGKACNHWKLYNEDFKRAAWLGNNAHRLSFEWAKIEPEEGKFNQEVLDHYHKVIASLKKHKLEPFVTLHHFTNPLWIAKKGGWENKETIKYYLRYVKKVATEFAGGEVNFWITINEPSTLVGMCWLEGFWAPHKSAIFKAYKVMKDFAFAHCQAYEVIKNIQRNAKAGFAHSLNIIEPSRKISLDPFVTAIAKTFGNELFLKMVDAHADFIGLNYYHRVFVSPKLSRPFFKLTFKGELTDMGWEIYPEGISKVLRGLKKYNLPIYITENGIADASDQKRPYFIVSHLKKVWEAIQEDVPVKGYFYWSLIDNFEWDSGFAKRFGLFEIDFKTQKRTPRESARIYKEICTKNEISERLTKKYLS